MKSKLPDIIIGTVSSLLATAIYFVFDRLSGKPLDTTQKSLILFLGLLIGLPTISIIAYRLVVWAIRNRIRPQVEVEALAKLEVTVRKELEQRLMQELERGTGIVRVFNNFPECESEILEQVKTSNAVKVFLQIGKTVLAGTTSFYDYLGRVITPEAKIRILYGSLDSPYLNERIAYERSSDYKEWRVDLEHAMKKIANLMEKNPGLRGRQHMEGYVWRLFIFDDFAYVQPYLYVRNNSDQAPVLKLGRFKSFGAPKEENSSSLYRAFANYFDFKWDEYRPNATSLSRLIPATDMTSVAVSARYHQFFVFAIPSRYIKQGSKEVPFHGIGGKMHQGETWTDTAGREVSEETGVGITLISSGHTHFHTTGAELDSVSLEDNPRPYCVYKRTREADPNFAHLDVLWLVGYEGNLQIKGLDELKPRAEIGAVICITGDMLRKTLQERVTYRDIDTSDDGSRVILGPNVDLNFDARAIPGGLAVLVAAAQRPKFLRRL